MATCGRSFSRATGCAAVVMSLLMLVSTAQALGATVAIGNAFHSPTQFTCKSNVAARQTYTASSNEIYYFAFDSAEQQYWDCQVQNVGYAKTGTFRFWGDDSHGGAQLWGCVNCKWNVDQFGVSIYVNNEWRYQYFWPSTANRKLM